MSRYAEGTQVSADKSRAEIEKTLERYGATSFFYGTEPGLAVIGFRAHDRVVKMKLPLPQPHEFEYVLRRGRAFKERRTQEAQLAAYQQAVRQRWRCLALAVKAKLEVVESGISTFEQEFLAHILTYDGRTVGEAVCPQLERSYASGKNVPLMLMAPGDQP